MSWVIIVLLFTALTITISFFVSRSRSKPTEQPISIDNLIATTGFDESKVVNTTTTKDPASGATTVTSTDGTGKQMSVTTAADGSKTATTVKDKDGTPLGSTQSNIANQIKSVAPVLVANIAAGSARDLVLIGGTKLLTRVSKEVSENGVKSAMQQGGKVVSRQGADLAMKFMGYMTKEGAEKAAQNAAEVGLRKVAKEAAEKAITEELAKNAAKYGGKKLASEVTEAAAKKALEEIGQKAAEKEAKAAVSAAGRKAVQTAAEKAMVRGGEQLAIKAATKAGVMAAKMGAKAGMGPVGWALMAFDALSMALDVAGCGGFGEGPFDNKTWEAQKKTFDDQVIAMVADSNKGPDDGPDPDPVRWPIVTGPFDKLDSAALQQRVIENVKTAMADPNNSTVKATLDKLKAAIAANTVKTDSDIDAFMDENLDLNTLLFEATQSLCTTLMGKSVIENGAFVGCSWPDQNKCEASFEWGEGKFNKDTSIYSSWNKEKQECNKDPVSQNMRLLCDSEKFPFNKDKKICELSQEYCLQKGMQWDGTNCKLSTGQNVAEMMFGTTVVRGLNAVYSADMYESCPAGSRPAGEIAALAGVVTGPLLATYIGQTMCANDKCPDGQDRVSGLCYDACKPGFDDKSDGITGMKVQGMCYKCPDGFAKTTAGMCHREGCDANLERGGQGTAGIGMCYPKCTDKFGPEYTDSNGMTLCLKGCPPGTRTEPLTCMRDVQIKRSAEAVKTCPPGWSASIAGPGGMCQQDCTDGYKKYGGLCYHPSVDTSLLLKTYNYGGCPSGYRTDPVTCMKDLQCSTNWCPGKWSWGVCKPASTSCTGPHATNRPKSCPVGYFDSGVGCTAVSRPVPQSKPLLEVGQCNDASKPEGNGGMCYQKCSDFGGSFQRSGPGECRMDAQSTSRDPRDRGAGVPYLKDVPAEQYSREPNGISYKVFQKKRKIPYGKGPNGC